MHACYVADGGTYMYIRYVGLLLTIPGGRKRDAVESLVVKMGAERGLGKGMISGEHPSIDDFIEPPALPMRLSINSWARGALQRGGGWAGSLMNFRAIFNALGPFLFGRAYAYGKAREMPGLAFVVASCSVALAEACFQMLSKKDLGLE